MPVSKYRKQNKKLLIEQEKTIKMTNAYLKLGNKKKAKQLFKKALKIDEKRQKLNKKIIKLTKK